MADFLNVIAETSLTFDITCRGRSVILQMHDGEWQLCENGGRVYIGKAALRWQIALGRVVDRLEAERFKLNT